MYLAEPRAAGTQELGLAAVVTQTAAIIISRHSEAEQRARAEQALRDSEARYRSLFNSMEEGFVLCDVMVDDNERPVDVRFMDANPSALRIMNADLMGRTAGELQLDLQPDWLEIFGRVARTGVGERHELTSPERDAIFDVRVFTIGAPRQQGRVAAIYQDISERSRADERRSLLVRELNHRVKNTIATVRAIANQTARGTTDPEQFVDTFQARLGALSHAHALLTRRSWESADIGELVREQLAMDDDGERLSIAGRRTLLGPEQLVALALALHELGTNSARTHASTAHCR
jgi:two-component system CheB/CheR fusion protein